ncbi:MAG: hypothetical protein AAB037_02985, partial [Chloroflexota bacterium]
HDPTKPRGPLAAVQLKRFFAEKWDGYLREGNLKITIQCNSKIDEVEPLAISLYPILEPFKEASLSTDRRKKFNCQLWFDPSGKSKVSIRHIRVPIIEDLKAIQAYGLEESVFADGCVKGYIDADFLKPLPARTGFEENQDWIQFLVELEKICPLLEAEVKELRDQEQQKRLTDIQKRAVELAREILDQEQFHDLDLLGGLRRTRGPVVHHGVTHPTGTETGKRPRKKDKIGHPGGLRVYYEEVAFEKEPHLHSRFMAGTVQVNTHNEDFKREQLGTEQERLAYGALMIGKETIVYNDLSWASNDFLEKMVSYLFQVKLVTGKSLSSKRVAKSTKAAT